MDDEWAIVKPLIPSATRGGWKREVDMRAVSNGVLYVLSTGCQWRYLPKYLHPKSTAHRYFCDVTPERWSAFITRCMSDATAC